MGLARAVSVLGQVIVRRLGDTGGTLRRDVESELDNIIAWAKVSPRNIKRDSSVVGNVGTGLDVLHTFSLPAGSLATDGDYLTIVYAGTFAANDNDKRVNAFFGGTSYEGIGTQDIDGAIGWRISATIIRLSSTSVRVSHLISINLLFGDSATPPNMSTAGVSGLYITRLTDITGLSNLNSNATTMEVKGETLAAVNNDVTQNLSIIELTQQ